MLKFVILPQLVLYQCLWPDYHQRPEEYPWSVLLPKATLRQSGAMLMSMAHAAPKALLMFLASTQKVMTVSVFHAVDRAI